MIMRLKSIFLILLCLLLTTPAGIAAEDASAVRGYSKAAGYDYVLFGSYPTEADGTVKPILWRVLRSGQGEAYMLSEYILFGAPVHGDYDHYAGWEKSDLYAYLNNVFINDAFSQAEQGALLIRTEDHALVTLITSNEMKDASIGFASNNDRLCESTAYAKILPDPPIFELPVTNNKGRWKPLYIYSKGKKYSPWWSRTRSEDYQHEQRRVMDEGKIGRISTGNSDLGVRPAITVDLSLLTIASGSGSFTSPYVLVPIGGEAAAAQAEPAAQPTFDASAAIAETPVPATEAPAPAPEPTFPPAQAQQNSAEQSVNVLPTVSPEELARLFALQNGQAADPAKATAQPTAIDTPTEAPAPTEPPEPTATPLPEGVFTAAANPETIHEKFPALTGLGFLPEGEKEFVYADEAAGLWLYCSQTLRIQINKYSGQNSSRGPLIWYEAHVYTRDNSELFDFYPFDKEHYTSYGDRYKELPEKIAQQHQLVFAINSDYFMYRIERDHEESYDYPIGTIIRDKEVLFDRPRKANSTVYPPLDVMALYPDGSISLHLGGSVTAKELLSMGATDALSFGPILVENGEVSPRSKEFGNTPNPRTGFGVVEPGHYVVVVAEGKRKGITEGESCIWLGEKMAALGCTQAINLDGGATSVLIFMGKQLNVTGNYNSSTNRKQNELLGIGISPAVQ